MVSLLPDLQRRRERSRQLVTVDSHESVLNQVQTGRAQRQSVVRAGSGFEPPLG
jgi:hypothetical protein